MKKSLLILSFLFFTSLIGLSQTSISSKFHAQNYWMPNKGPYTGQLQNNWNNIVQSGVKYMRVGGKDYDGMADNPPWTASELANGANSIIAEIKSYGIQPIIQVPITHTLTAAANATVCAGYVNDINNTYSANVTYWQICNEPDGSYGPNFNDASEIRTLIQAVSTAMKGVSGQSGIKIIGPSLETFNPTSNSTMMDDLIGGSYDITGEISPGIDYIDYVSFHIYPFRNESYWQTGSGITSGGPIQRSEVIDYLTSATRLKVDLAHLQDRIDNYGQNPGLKIAITEANISYQQNTAAKGIGDLGPASFLAGQFWNEMDAIAMEKGVEFISFWSVIEGTDQDPNATDWITDIGYIGRELAVHRSTYWHYKLMADYFKSGSGYTTNFYPGTVKDANGNLITDVKAFASKVSGKSQVVVTIMNQKDIPGSYSFEARTNNATASTSSNFNITLSTGTSYTITGTLAAEETQWWVYNCNGVYEGKWVYNVDKNISNLPPDWIGTGVAASNSVTSTCSSGCTGLAGSNVTIGVSGATTVTWIADPNLTPVGSYSATVTITQDDPYYTYISTASTGCTYTKDVQVTHSIPIGPPYASVTNITHATCGSSNGSATVTGGGCSPFTYSWSTGATTATVTGLSAGTYTVTASCWSYPYSASFLAVIQNNVTPVSTWNLTSQTISSNANYIASETITAGPSLTVGSGTTVHFTAGENVHMGDGFNVTGTTNFRATVRKTNCMEPQ